MSSHPLNNHCINKYSTNEQQDNALKRTPKKKVGLTRLSYWEV